MSSPTSRLKPMVYNVAPFITRAWCLPMYRDTHPIATMRAWHVSYHLPRAEAWKARLLNAKV